MFLNRRQFLFSFEYYILKSYSSMKTLAKCHVCNHCVIGEKTFKIYLSGPVSNRDFRETGHSPPQTMYDYLNYLVPSLWPKVVSAKRYARSFGLLLKRPKLMGNEPKWRFTIKNKQTKNTFKTTWNTMICLNFDGFVSWWRCAWFYNPAFMIAVFAARKLILIWASGFFFWWNRNIL